MAFSLSKGAALSKAGSGELGQRLLFVLLVLVIYRIGVHVPVPGLNPDKLHQLFNNQSNTIIGLFNMFSGGALMRFSVFALGIMPYISSSIIMQLLTAVLPSMEQLKKEGEAGQRKINQYTRYGTVILSLVQGAAFTKVIVAHGAALNPGLSFYMITVLTLIAGTLFLMWLGEQITERGVGNGISMIIFFGIVARFPGAISRTLDQVRQGEMQIFTLLLVLAMIIIVTLVVVFIESGQRRITINYAKQQRGRKLYGAQSTHLPLKINMAGVIPPIFALSLILFPASLAKWFGNSPGFYWLGKVGLLLEPGQPLYILIFFAAVMFFCFFYTALVFNPREIADNLKRSGGFIPGIRPGEQTARYIDQVISRLTLFGAVYISVVSLLPQMVSLWWHIPFVFGGTSLLIVVVVVIDFVSQVQSHLLSYKYGSVMKRGGRQ
ncbi:MAG: preprotein translocase subunit SecY [Gammaproteobacteria bacterium]|nr:preprotein translocase subunit SecY [Gammaproteobacteria bacterium]